MKVILDECLPKRLARELPGHDVLTVPQMGWSGISNGKLLALICGNFEVFVTGDGNLPFQQNLKDLPVAVIVLRARSNKIEDLGPLVPALLAALASIKTGELRTLTFP